MIDMYNCGICAFRNNVTTLSTNKQTKETFITNIACRMIASHIYRGPGENRTPVQTRKPYAFYMLIFA